MQKNKLNFKSLLNILLSIFLAGIPLYLYFLATNKSKDKFFFESVFFWYLAAILIFSARYAKNIYLFQFIDFICNKSSLIGGKYRSKIYGAAFCIPAIYAFYKWLTFQ